MRSIFLSRLFSLVITLGMVLAFTGYEPGRAAMLLRDTNSLFLTDAA